MLNEVGVSIPSRPEFIQILRSVLAAVAARADLSLDAIEDLRLAVSEACAYLLDIGKGNSTMQMQVTAEDRGSIDVVVSIDGSADALATADGRSSITWHILEALTDEARYEETETGPSIRLTKQVAAV